MVPGLCPLGTTFPRRTSRESFGLKRMMKEFGCFISGGTKGSRKLFADFKEEIPWPS